MRGIAIVPLRETSRLPATRLDSPWLARVHRQELRSRDARTRLSHVPPLTYAFADEPLKSTQELAANAHVPLGDPVSRVARQHDEHAQPDRAIPRLAGDSHSVIRCYNVSTF